MKFVARLLSVITLLAITSNSFAVTVIKESRSNEDIKFIARPSGVFTESLKVNGTDGSIVLGPSGGSVTSTVNGSLNMTKFLSNTVTTDSSSTGTINSLTITSGIHKFTASTTITLNGIAVPSSEGTVLIIENETGNNLVINHLSGSAAQTQQQISIQGGSALTLANGDTVTLVYTGSGVAGRWRLKNITTVTPTTGNLGEVNTVTNPNDAGNWSAGAGMAVATTSTTSDLPLGTAASGAINQTISTAIKITRSSGTNSVFYRWTMPTALKNRKLKVQWDQHALSGYASGDLKVQVRKNSASDYSGSYTAYTLSTDSSGVSGIPNMDGRFVTYFDADSSDYYELDVTGVSGTTALVIANVIVGPGIQPQGAAVSGWTTYTPTGTFNTNTTYTGRYRRVGSSMEIENRLTFSGAPNATNLLVNMPSGFTIDTTSFNNDAWNTLGYGTFNDSGSNFYSLRIDYQSTTQVFIARLPQANGYLTRNQVDQANPGTIGAATVIDLHWTVPVNEWAGAGTVNLAQNDCEYVYNSSGLTTANTSDTTSFAYGPTGAALGSINSTNANQSTSMRVRFKTPISPADAIIAEINDPAGNTWVVSSYYFPWLRENTSFYGMRTTFVGNTTDVDVQFGNAGATTFNGTYGTTNKEAWSTFASLKWRVKKCTGGQAVGFSTRINGSTQAGLIPAAGNPPTQQILTSGSGTYTTPTGVAWIRVRMVGGGGGGSGSGVGGSSSNNGGTGGNTTFGSSLLTANGGGGGVYNANAQTTGGTATVNSPAVGQGWQGGATSASGYVNPSSGSNGTCQNDGAASPFGGAGRGGGGSDALGSAASVNTGSGGGGGGTSNPGGGSVCGQGGAAGGFIDAIISAPAATYAYSVGTAGTAGTTATTGHVGYAGGSGIIMVEEHYN